MKSAVKKIFLIIVLGLVCVIVWYIFIPYAKQLRGNTLATRIDIEMASLEREPVRVTFGTSTLSVTLAASQEERARGLSRMSVIEKDEGMLFVFEESGYPGIWMKEMVFPIDIAWFDEDFRIVYIEENVSPSTYPKTFRSNVPARYVLEVNAGYFAEHNIKIGDELRLVQTSEL